MGSGTLIGILALAVAALAGCGGEPRDGFNETEWHVVQTLANPAPPALCPPELLPERIPDGDPNCDALAELGQKFFYEREFAGPTLDGGLGEVGRFGQVSCADCHQPPMFVDHTSTPRGTGRPGRNTPPTSNTAFYEDLTWGGKWPTLAELVRGPLENAQFMNSDRLWLARIVLDDYREEYEAVFGPVPDEPFLDVFSPRDPPNAAEYNPYRDSYRERTDGIPKADLDDRQTEIVDDILDNVGFAIESYERRLVSLDSDFDRWVRDEDAPFSESAQRGLQLFIGEAACVECHSGPMLADNEFHNTGVAQVGDLVPPPCTPETLGDGGCESGRGGVVEDPSLLGFFRTPSLRNVGQTAPYMHTGSVPTLEDVIWFYHQGGDAAGFAGAKEPLMVPLGLSDQDVSDIAAFLATLDGDPFEQCLLRNTSDDSDDADNGCDGNPSP